MQTLEALTHNFMPGVEYEFRPRKKSKDTNVMGYPRRLKFHEQCYKLQLFLTAYGAKESFTVAQLDDFEIKPVNATEQKQLKKKR